MAWFSISPRSCTYFMMGSAENRKLSHAKSARRIRRNTPSENPIMNATYLPNQTLCLSIVICRSIVTSSRDHYRLLRPPFYKGIDNAMRKCLRKALVTNLGELLTKIFQLRVPGIERQQTLLSHLGLLKLFNSRRS